MEVMLAALLSYVQENHKVCPKPPLWNDLWSNLPDLKRNGYGWDPPPPLILAAWHETTDKEKAERLVLHIGYAFAHGALETVDQYLRALKEDEWVHKGEA